MVFCSKCGKELPEDAHFCLNCGTRTAKGEAAKVPTPYKEKVSEMEKQLEKGFQTASEEIKKAFNKAKEEIRRAAD